MAVSDSDISEAALMPKSTTQDGRTVVERDVRELMDAQQNADTGTAATRTHMGLRSVQLRSVRPQ